MGVASLIRQEILHACGGDAIYLTPGRSGRRCCGCSKDIDNAVVDPVLLVLRHALRDPHDVADFLLAQPHVGEEHAVVELLLVGRCAALDLLFIQDLVEHLALAVAHLGEDDLIGRALLHALPDLVEVLCHRELHVPVGVQETKVGVEPLAVVAGELCADGVEGDVERAPVGLEGEHLGHDLLRGASEGRAERGEVVQVGLVEGVTHDFDVHLVEVL